MKYFFFFLLILNISNIAIAMENATIVRIDTLIKSLQSDETTKSLSFGEKKQRIVGATMMAYSLKSEYRRKTKARQMTVERLKEIKRITDTLSPAERDEIFKEISAFKEIESDGEETGSIEKFNKKDVQRTKIITLLAGQEKKANEIFLKGEAIITQIRTLEEERKQLEREYAKLANQTSQTKLTVEILNSLQLQDKREFTELREESIKQLKTYSEAYDNLKKQINTLSADEKKEVEIKIKEFGAAITEQNKKINQLEYNINTAEKALNPKSWSYADYLPSLPFFSKQISDEKLT